MSSNDKNNDVIDAEVVDDGRTPYNSSRTTYTSYTSYSGTGSRNGFDGGRVTFISMAGPSAPGHQGLPLAPLLTLSLFLACLFQWGFLAALGFAFFYAIASALGVYNNVRTIMQGRMPNPWLWRIGSWVVCMLLVSWLV